jgi:hypothetical protein
LPLDTSRPEITQALTRGVCRFLTESAITPLREFKLASKRRADVAGLDEKGRFTIVEVKSSPADFLADNKWPDYLAHADFFYFAVDASFPLDILPADQGVLIADGFDAALHRTADECPMNGNRRRHQLLRFARQAARQLDVHMDRRA